MDSPDLHRQFEAELDRLGLPIHSLPGGGLATWPGALEELIARLRTLKPGVTWWDVFPDLPRHWKPGRPETWTGRYRPFGPYDYQSLPTGPALLVVWSTGDATRLDTLLALARAAGWPVYGAGMEPTGPHESECLARIVLERGTSTDRYYEFGDWVNRQEGFEVAVYARIGDEEYLD